MLVEDSKELCEAIELQLEKAGYGTDCCDSGQEALYCAVKFPYDVVLLNRMLPQMDGPSVLDSPRRMDVVIPITITTALDGVNDRIDSLNTGADDYLVKPYTPGEPLARVRAVARRPGELEPAHARAYSNISPGPEKRELTGQSGMVQLGKRESALVEYLIRSAGQILTRGMILSYIQRPDSEMEEGNLDNYVYFLKRCLKSVNGAVQIKTVHGTGYCLKAEGNP